MPFRSFWDRLFRNSAALLVLGLTLLVGMVGGTNTNSGAQNGGGSETYLVSRLSRLVLDHDFIEQVKPCLNSFAPSRVPPDFVLAVALTETYGRPAWRQQIEFQVARLELGLSGQLPDFSLGIAQVKPSTARLVLGRSRLSNRELLDVLANPCLNLRLAGRYLDYLAREQAVSAFTPAAADVLLRQYNGQSTEADWQNKLYRQVVWKVFQTLAR